MLMTPVAPPSREEIHAALDRLLDLAEKYNLIQQTVERAKGEVAIRLRAAGTPEEYEGVNALAPQQRACAELAALGLADKEISRKLDITEATVKVHLKAALRRLGASTRTDLIRFFPPETDNSIAPRITPRESDVLEALCAGERNKTIALRTNMTEATVKVHLKSLLSKFGARNRTELARKAIAMGLTAREPAEA